MAQRKPTVLFLAAWYPTSIDKSHGIFIRNHALALSKFCKVIVAYAYTVTDLAQTTLSKNTVNENFEEWLVAYKKNSLSVPFLSDIIKYINFKTAYGVLVKELSRSEINIRAIQVNIAFPTSIALPLFKKQWGVPHTVLEHWTGYLPRDGNYKGFLVKHYTEKIIASASKIFYVSEEQKIAMNQHGLRGDYQLIYNVVDTSIFNRGNQGKSEKPLLIHVSALDNVQKNVDGILNVIQSLQKNNYAFDFVFIGGGPGLVALYNKRVEERNLKNVLFIGPKTPFEISEYMRKAWALVLFSNYENMPVVVLEALACGLPVISTNTGCLDTMITAEFGRLVGIGDEQGLAKNLQDLMDGKLNFDSAKMSDYVSSRADYEVVGKQLYDYYKPLLNS